jgi:hypothetical protein
VASLAAWLEAAGITEGAAFGAFSTGGSSAASGAKALGRPRIARELKERIRKAGDPWKARCARHCKQFGVNPDTMGRAARK